MSDVDPQLKMIYDESVRGLDMQSATLDELRNRTGVLLAAAALSSAFLGATALQRHHVLYWATVLATLLFVGSVILCLAVLWPSEDWEFAFNARTLDETYIASGVDGTAMCRSMALGNGRSRDVNREKLRCRFKLFRWACGTLAASLVFWLLDIGIR
jgi:hypothetical protein